MSDNPHDTTTGGPAATGSLTGPSGSEVLDRAAAFLVRDGRLLEQRLYEVVFDGETAGSALAALGGYRNADGGYGHGLEPDKRCPASLPIDAEVALQTLTLLAAADPGVAGTARAEAERVCGWLDTVAAPEGPVSLALPVMRAYPHAVHWADWTLVPGLNPTAGLAGLLHGLGVRHDWLDRATGWCLDTVEREGFPSDAHAVSEVMALLAHLPERYRARGSELAAAVPGALAKAEHYRAEGDDPAYGVTPLHLAPTPDSPWRSLFSDERIDGHLDRLLRDQREDGGWALTWEPPSPSATYDYRGAETLRALRVLRAYGRLGH
ncbi:hypothetical protein AB0J21_19420 [Streptomyces sp. NPDC049954]|uniref:hypothetical protein n=1 Tax=Streptomyces sp. NPDC049954 TaxID=3155779 RepID=UPI003435148E